jgi:spore coat polysaccharide biosynthesis protein SpsF (cytidylyltransferase family)
MKVVAVVQARMSSTRLPGKVLMPLAGEPALMRLVARLRLCRRVDEIVVATSTEADDDAVAACSERSRVSCVRGPLDDVLERYRMAAAATKADVVVRITGDCPLHDHRVIDRCVAAFAAANVDADYASNVDERTYPRGLDTEVFRRSLLDAAAAVAVSPFEREHVTPWIRRTAPRLSIAQAQDLSMLRWTLDRPDDFEFIAWVYEHVEDASDFDADDVYALLLHHPDRLHFEPDVARDPKLVQQRIEALLGSPA